jgi:acyl-CoA oxidase
VIQVARAALKTLAALRTNPSTALTPSTAYLSTLTTPPPSSVSWNNLPTLLHLVNLRAALSVQRLERLVQAGKQFGNLSHECVAVSKAVVEAFLCSRMVAALEEGGLLNAGASKEVKAVSMLVIHFVCTSSTISWRWN